VVAVRELAGQRRIGIYSPMRYTSPIDHTDTSRLRDRIMNNQFSCTGASVPHCDCRGQSEAGVFASLATLATFSAALSQRNRI